MSFKTTIQLENFMIPKLIKLTLVAAFFLPYLSHAQAPTVGAFGAAPDEFLLSNGQNWHYHTSTASAIQELLTREPTVLETPIIEKAKSLLANSSAKSMALVDGNTIVWVGYKFPAWDGSRFLSYSIGKTVTSMGIGKAICSGKFALNSIAGDIVPELKETDLGKATVRDLLMMSSGTWIGNKDSTVWNADQDFAIRRGRMSWLDLLGTPKISTAEVGSSGEKRKPGESFVYRSTDPLLLGVIINKTTGTTYAKWIEREVLIPAGIKKYAIIGQDWSDFGNSDGNVRMTMEDWIRFALWVKNNEAKQDCFGNYVREASKTQIQNVSKIMGQRFDGYGYLTWTENRLLKDSYWAVGYGGQRIGWNHQNKRMLLAFSNVENYMDKLYALYAEWAALPIKD
jgi:CubicO group peptidase (beta-lactamase class C family)